MKGVDYRFVLWNITGKDAINRINNSELGDKAHYEYGLWCK